MIEDGRARAIGANNVHCGHGGSAGVANHRPQVMFV